MFGEPRQALASWREWRSRTSWPPDEASLRVLPLIYRIGLNQLIDTEDVRTIQRAYRTTWARNSRVIEAGVRALSLLRDDAIPTMVLKGTVLIQLYYRSMGVRPLADVDILVRPSDAEKAFRALTGAGWQPLSSLPINLERRRRHSTGLRDGAGCDVDLHWRPLVAAGREDWVWSEAIPITISGCPTLAMAPTDELLVALVHGTGSPGFSVQWVADAVTMLQQSASDILWPRLVEMAVERDQAARVGLALDYLRSELKMPVPTATIAALEAARRARSERVSLRAVDWASEHGYHGAASVIHGWDRWRRLRRFTSRSERPADFLQFVQLTSEMASRTELLVRLGRRSTRLGRRTAERVVSQLLSGRK